MDAEFVNGLEENGHYFSGCLEKGDRTTVLLDFGSVKVAHYSC